MLKDLREKGGLHTNHQENGSVVASGKTTAPQQPNPRLWLGLRDPRIVRVSRALGGKDRHSKVRTVKGLRDRRVRLSVPTAVQLYDLQEKLGFSQPSKVVDWLLDASQREIDKLPPLQLLPPAGAFADQFQSTTTAAASSSKSTGGILFSNESDSRRLVMIRGDGQEGSRNDDVGRTLPTGDHQDQLVCSSTGSPSLPSMLVVGNPLYNYNYHNANVRGGDSILQGENHKSRPPAAVRAPPLSSLKSSSQFMLGTAGTPIFQSFQSPSCNNNYDLKNVNNTYQTAVSPLELVNSSISTLFQPAFPATNYTSEQHIHSEIDPLSTSQE